MTFIRVLLALIGFQCIFSSVISRTVSDSEWVYTSDFTSDELASLSPKEEHELLLKSFTQKPASFLEDLFGVETIANGIGNDFFELTSDEKSNIETKAIIKAAFHCLTQIQFQERFMALTNSALREAANFFNKTGSLGAAYTKLWSKFDDDVKNETCYTTFRNENKQQAGQLSKKTYQYGIPKSEGELQKSILELTNDPQWKKICAFVHTLDSTFGGRIFVRALTEVAKLPVKGEAVQKIFEESINEMIPSIKDVSPNSRNDTSTSHLFSAALDSSFIKTVREKLQLKIEENPNLKEDFEKILKRVCESEVLSYKLMRMSLNLNCSIPTYT